MQINLIYKTILIYPKNPFIDTYIIHIYLLLKCNTWCSTILLLNSTTTLIKKFPEFIQKIQNTSFIHQK